MIAIFDEDGGGDVDFQEFVSGLSAFSSKGNKEEKLHFAFKVYDIDRDGYISNGELFIVLKMMVGSNLKDMQLQQIVDKTMMEADVDGDGRISFDEFKRMVENTDVSFSMTLGESPPFDWPFLYGLTESMFFGRYADANQQFQINSNTGPNFCMLLSKTKAGSWQRRHRHCSFRSCIAPNTTVSSGKGGEKMDELARKNRALGIQSGHPIRHRTFIM